MEEVKYKCPNCGLPKKECFDKGWEVGHPCKWCNGKTDWIDAPYGICFECGNHGPKALEFIDSVVYR